MKRLVILFIGVLCFFNLSAQQTLNRTEIKFKDPFGNVLKHPQVGGLNSPQFNGVDLNNDNQEDLVVFDRKGDVILPFLYDGNDYVYAPEYVEKFPKIKYFMLTYDYNCDGIKDLFCYPVNFPVDGLEVYTASYDNNNEIVFTQKIFYGYVCNGATGQLCNVLNYPGFGGSPVNLQVLKIDIPGLEDIDNDGDMDVVSFHSGGGYIQYYENQSQDLGFGCDSLIFEFKSECWGRIYEPSIGLNVNMSPDRDSCPYKNSFIGDGRNERHTGSSLTLVDMDNDNDMELILGDISYPDLTLLTNGGSIDTAWMVAQDLDFPSNSRHASVPDFPASFLFDVDKDGDRDLIAARNEDSDASENYNVSWYYKNIGTEQLPVYDYIEDNFLVNEMIDYGSYSMPAFFDYNGDSLLDLVVGSLGLFQSGGIQDGVLALYENIGVADTPIFKLVDEDYLNVSALTARRLAPGFGDVDNDGDVDLLLGEEFGSLFYYENTAGAGNPVNFATPVASFQNIDVVQTSMPQIIDIDRDGKNDLIIGQNQGFVKYYRNTSTNNTPVFTIQPAPNNSENAWGDVDARPTGFSLGYASPKLVDINNNYELFVGSVSGTILHYQDVETTTNGSFTLLTDNYGLVDVGLNATLDIADINNDGQLDFAIGNGRGGISIYSDGLLINTVEPTRSIANLVKVFPNPANNQITIEPMEGLKTFDVTIYNAIGQMLYQNHDLNALHQVTVADWESGIYFVQVRNNDEVEVKTVVIQH